MDKNNFKLDFVAIGAQRSATTWIYECLRSHPEISMCEPKELYFFGGPKYNFGIHWYRKHFNPQKTSKFFGEYSTAYMYSEKVARRIKRNFPEAKIIACLRNPVDRFVSHISSQGKTHDFSQAIIKNHELSQRGLYFSYLKPYFDLFGKDNMLIMIFDDIIKDPQLFIETVYRFIGADSNFVPPTLKNKVNPSREYRMEPIKRLVDYIINFLQERSEGIYLYNFLKRLGMRRVFYAVDALNSVPIDRGDIPMEIRRELLNMYKKDIGRLEKLIDRDLSFWK